MNATTGIELKFIDPSLDVTTSLLAEGYEAISIFVNDICDEDVLQELHKHGVVRTGVATQVSSSLTIHRNISLYDVQDITT